MSPSDISLLARWANDGDAEAFKEIASRHAAMVYATCKRILRNAAEAEDVAQECFITLAKTSKRPKTHLAAWLQVVATNRSLDRIRSEKRRKERETRFVAEQAAPTGTQWDDLSVHIDEAIAELPENLRQPIVLHFFEDQTHEAIANQMGLSRTAITHRIQKGIERIRRSLRRRGAIVAAAALGALMGKHAVAETVPKTLTVALSKLALAGTANVAALSAPAALAALGGLVIMKKIALAAVVLLALGFLVWQLAPIRPTSPQPEIAPPARRETIEDITRSEPAQGPEDLAHREPEVSAPESQPAQSAAAPADSPGAMTGKVYKAETGEPLPGLMMQCEPLPASEGDVLRTETDEQGHYRFEGLADGTFKVSGGYGLPGLAVTEEGTVVTIHEAAAGNGRRFPYRNGLARDGDGRGHGGPACSRSEGRGTRPGPSPSIGDLYNRRQRRVRALRLQTDAGSYPRGEERQGLGERHVRPGCIGSRGPVQHCIDPLPDGRHRR